MMFKKFGAQFDDSKLAKSNFAVLCQYSVLRVLLVTINTRRKGIMLGDYLPTIVIGVFVLMIVLVLAEILLKAAKAVIGATIIAGVIIILLFPAALNTPTNEAGDIFQRSLDTLKDWLIQGCEWGITKLDEIVPDNTIHIDVVKFCRGSSY